MPAHILPGVSPSQHAFRNFASFVLAMDIDERREQVLLDAVYSLTTGKPVVIVIDGNEQTYNFDSVRQYLYDNADDCEQYDKLQDQLMLATAKELPEIRDAMKELVDRAAAELVKEITPLLLKAFDQKRAEQHADFIASQFDNDADFHL